MAIVATPGDATANSFVTAQEADDYVATRLNASAWTGTNKEIALLEAARDLSLLDWEGSRVTTTQALSWPRQFAIDPDKPSVIFVGQIALLYFGITVVPQRVKNAQCELALEYLRAGTTDLNTLDPTLAVTKKVIGPLETDYAEPWLRAQGLARFPRVVAWITPLLADSNVGGSLNLERV